LKGVQDTAIGNEKEQQDLRWLVNILSMFISID